jgi:His/Glu/Gln/Arg/opine family amino acid ABC transporter permease subunit
VVRSKKWPVVQQVLSVYLGIVRGIPFLLLLLLVYFNTPVKGVFKVSVVTLTIYNSAYIAEIIRGESSA